MKKEDNVFGENNCSEDNMAKEYLDQLSEKECQACAIAKNHLGTSFNIKKSVGFIRWLGNVKPT